MKIKKILTAIVVLGSFILVIVTSPMAWAITAASLNLDVRDHTSGPGAGNGSSWSGGTLGSGMNPGSDGEFSYKLPLNTSALLKSLTALVYDNDSACEFTVSLSKRSVTDTDIDNDTIVSTSVASVDSTSSQAVILNLTGADQKILAGQVYYVIISLVGTASTSCSVNALKIDGIF